MIYLASPYSAPAGMWQRSVEADRHRQAVHAAIHIMSTTGEAVFSPIAHSHYLHVWSDGKIGGDWQQWAEFDRAVIGACSRFIVLKIEGWGASRGISAEMDIASALRIPIEYQEWPARG